MFVFAHHRSRFRSRQDGFVLFFLFHHGLASSARGVSGVDDGGVEASMVWLVLVSYPIS